MSSFKKAIKANPDQLNKNKSDDLSKIVSGVKPWLNNGLGIVSSGLKQLDNIIGGGIGLGTVMLLEIDTYSNYGDIIFKYSLVESISHRHDVLIVCNDNNEGDKYLHELPFNLSLRIAEDNLVTNGEIERIQESNSSSSEHLKIAWQYEKYLNREGSSESKNEKSYCFSYDLSKRLQTRFLGQENVKICGLIKSHSSNYSNNTNFEYLHNQISDYINTSSISTENPKRIFLLNFHEIINSIQSPDTLEAARFLLKLKHLIFGKKISIFVSMHSSSLTNKSIGFKLTQVADTVLLVDSFTGKCHAIPYEFKEFHGFFEVRKLQHYGSIVPYRPPYDRYGLKRDRRKLHIEPLHLPPEESRAFGSDVEKGLSKTSLHDNQTYISQQSMTNGSINIKKNEIENTKQVEVSNPIQSTASGTTNSLSTSIAALRAAREAKKKSDLNKLSNSKAIHFTHSDVDF